METQQIMGSFCCSEGARMIRNLIRLLGLVVFCVGCYFIVLNILFNVRVYRLGMSLFVIGTAMTLLPLAIV